FLDAKAGYRPSYIWRSFIAVKELVRKGCKWNIGNGCSVNVWEDFWLADHRSLGPKPYNSKVIYVRDLLNNEGEFSCKSAYLLALETSQELVQNNSDEAIKIFHAIWMAKDFCSIILDHSPTHWDDFMMILLGLWTRRNKHFHGQAKRREVDVEVMANRLLLDYLNENKTEIARREGTP
ncbi:hypothetical protein Tco_0094968, partial [Tanacetum coccineum]